MVIAYLSTDYMIRQLQEVTKKLEDPKIKEEWGPTKYKQVLNDSRSLRMDLVSRLRKMDRRRPDFFPKDSYVEYRHPKSTTPKNAVVTGRNETLVFIQIEGEEGELKVEPLHLKLRFIKR